MKQGIVGKAQLINGVNIRLTFERWFHISTNHPELAGKHYDVLEAIYQPHLIVEGLTILNASKFRIK